MLFSDIFISKTIQTFHNYISSSAVTWLKYCRYGVNFYPINQSINLSFKDCSVCIFFQRWKLFNAIKSCIIKHKSINTIIVASPKHWRPIHFKLKKNNNKRPMDHTTHLRKSSIKINTLAQSYITITLMAREKTLIAFILFVKTWVPLTQACFMRSLVEIGPAVLGEKIFTFRQCIFAISLLSPLGNMRGHSY